MIQVELLCSSMHHSQPAATLPGLPSPVQVMSRFMEVWGTGHATASKWCA